MPFLIELLARGAVLSGLVLLLGSLPGVRRLAAHGTMLAIAFVWLVVMPALVVAGPRVTLGLLPAEPTLTTPPTGFLRQGARLATPPVSAAELAPPEAAPGASSLRPNEERPAPVTMAYLVVALTVLLWRAGGALRVHRIVRRSRRVPAMGVVATSARSAARRIGLRALPDLRVSKEVPLPVVFGILRPVVVLSKDAADWPPARLEAVLLHELAHVRRRDILTRLIADVACALHWCNPLVWFAAARLRAEAEVACDGAVVRAGVGAESYARELLQLARAYNGSRVLSPAIGIVGASSLAARVRAILQFGGARITSMHIVGGTILACSTALGAAVVVPVPMRAQGRAVSALNISNGGPEISSNAAGLQARWSDHGRHSAMFVSGDVDLSDAGRGQLRGSGRLLLIEEKSGGGIDVFEWQNGQSGNLPESVRRSLETGAAQLRSLYGKHGGFPGASLTGLPAWSDDPNAHVVQAGWKDGGVRYGVALRGTWHDGQERLESNDANDWLVLFAYDARQGTVRTLEIQSGSGGVATYRINGVIATYDTRVHDWSADAFRLLQRMKPPDIEF